MKNALALAITATLISATSAFAQTAPVLPDVVIGEGNMQMGISESYINDGNGGSSGAFAAGMQSGDLSGAMLVETNVLQTTVDNLATDYDSEGGVLSNEDELQTTKSASGTVSFGENIESINDIDGSDETVEGSIDM